MANRPIFLPNLTGKSLVDEKAIDFDWFPGFAISQKQKSIESLHNKATKAGISPILDVSSKSLDPKGAAYSAFRLKVEHSMHGYIPLECAFQGSKVFSDGGPYNDLYTQKPIDAKRDQRLRQSGTLEGFEFEGTFWKLIPQSAFYDFLYLNALAQKRDLIDEILEYAGFSDIEFNPKKSINCQARSCALTVSLVKRDVFDSIVSNKKLFLQFLHEYNYGRATPSGNQQSALPFDL
jgi:hypothetical protein